MANHQYCGTLFYWCIIGGWEGPGEPQGREFNAHNSESAIAVSVILAGIASCDGRSAAPEAGSVDANRVRMDLAAGGACAECIALQRIASLGERDGAGYLEEVRPRVVTDAGGRLRDGATMDSIYTSRIDVIDLDRGVMAASQPVDGVFSLFTEDGLLVRNELLPDGSPIITLWHAEFTLR
jgi:hypothetical protein